MARIVHHEDWQPTDLVTFLFGLWIGQGRRGAMPPLPGPSYDEDGNALPAPPLATVAAYVNHGRWVADCPTPGCGGALCLSRQASLFLCPQCWNAANGGQWMAVTFPAAKQQIEALLLRRPAADDWTAPARNWRPGESTAQLRAENAARGLTD